MSNKARHYRCQRLDATDLGETRSYPATWRELGLCIQCRPEEVPPAEAVVELGRCGDTGPEKIHNGRVHWLVRAS